MEGVYSRIMNVKITADSVCGEVDILSSKTELHRLIILSALCDNPTKIYYSGVLSKDVQATITCVKAIGASVTVDKNTIKVEPIAKKVNNVELNCGESGSTLRFMLPVASALGLDYKVNVEGRLSKRPLSPLYDLMVEEGISFSAKEQYPMFVSGKLNGGNYKIDGSVSSQFITGLLIALAVSENGGKVEVKGDFQSKPYVDVTVELMRKFGASVTENGHEYSVTGGGFVSPGKATAGGDWSNSAFFVALGAIGGKIKIKNLDGESVQGDKAIYKLLTLFGAKVKFSDGVLEVEKGDLKGISIDAKDVPDLVPVLAVVGCFSKGETKIYNAERLRLKESDRIQSVVSMINSIGGEAIATKDGMIIKGKSNVLGGTVDSFNDHRIVMSATVASALCKNGVTILGAEAVKKSYPDFFVQIKKLGVNAVEV